MRDGGRDCDVACGAVVWTAKLPLKRTRGRHWCHEAPLAASLSFVLSPRSLTTVKARLCPGHPCGIVALLYTFKHMGTYTTTNCSTYLCNLFIKTLRNICA